MKDKKAKKYSPGMGEAVADRTINRKVNGKVETWADVAKRVAMGNALLITAPYEEYDTLHQHLRQASILMSGRHLQHGDENQPYRNMEVFTNCATAASTFLSFYLLLNGSGVGRAYDNNMIVVDFNDMPIVVPVIDSTHPDVQSGEIQFIDRRAAEHVYKDSFIEVFDVEDSREGWAKALEKIEVMTFSGDARNSVLLLDFTKVRCKGSPIGGMQGRPASGPCALMVAISNIAKLRDAGMAPWRAAMYADHYAAEGVLVGGARRAARMATKVWTDPDVLDFIAVKRGGFLWSSNNSVTVDERFWRCVRENKQTEKHLWAKKVFEAICDASYHDGTGEPGIINQHKLVENNTGLGELENGVIANSKKYQLSEEATKLMKTLVKRFKKSPLKMITNPCGEISLTMLGGYCVIADVVPYHAQDDDDAEDAFRVATRALIRVNTMDALYSAEVKRTNRIGVGMTGIHEYAWKRFKLGWKDLVDEQTSIEFWRMLSRFKRAVKQEAMLYSNKLGLNIPHTDTTIKPAGTTSKLFGLTEGAHLPSMREFLRWVQFRNDDPLVSVYETKGYPVKHLKTYSGTTVVGFPTQPEICKLGMGDKLVTAAEATPEEQFEWLRLLEKYWIVGVDEDGEPLQHDSGNQVSYTLKYKPEVTSYSEFKEAVLLYQSGIRCCSVMPQSDTTAYEYQPEQSVNKHEYELISEAIERATQGEKVAEDIGIESVDCEGGACPVDFFTEKVQ